MSEEKKDILDFFFDGDIIITGAQGYTNISTWRRLWTTPSLPVDFIQPEPANNFAHKS